MTRVTQEEFFAEVGQRDINPRVDVSTLKNRHHVSDWEDRERVRVGRSVSDAWGIEPTQFFLADRASPSSAEGRD